MGRRALTVGSDELFAIDEEEYVRDYVGGQGAAYLVDLEYEGGSGDDDDLSDMTAENVIGCHSVFRPSGPQDFENTRVHVA